MESGLREGTVTVLFTDLEGSTTLLAALGAPAYAELLEAHRAIVRAACGRHGGVEIGTEGDAFFMVFHRAAAALRAAIDAQVALRDPDGPVDGRVRARMGVHTCDVLVSGRDYVGLGVHRAARICAAAHGGQVLVSHATRELLADEAPELRVRELGRFSLKDFPEPQALFQLLDDRLEVVFPMPRTMEAARGNLVVPLGGLLGRDEELVALEGLVRAGCRLLTLVGPGGIGKTRLALELCARAADQFDDGAYVVDLTSLTDAQLVPGAIAETLGLDRTLGQSLSGFLAPRDVLVLLDNFEQVIEAAAEVGALLAAAPGLCAVVTSREPLRLATEKVVPVAPLSLPVVGEDPASSASVALFAWRARSLAPDFELTDDVAATAGRICARLDGLPLAIELAAARVRLLSLEQILARLDDRFALLTSGGRDVPGRHQTLRAALEWSVELLDDEERRLYARCSVFAGGFTLEAAEEVCDATLDRVGSLLDKSILGHDLGRFSMLETIREHAAEKLLASGEADEVRRRHAGWCVRLARSLREGWELAPIGRLASLEPEDANLRAALDWLEGEDPDAALELCALLGWYWHARGAYDEGMWRLTDALDASDDQGAVRADALAALASILGSRGDYDDARLLLEESIERFRALGGRAGEAEARISLAWVELWSGHVDTARECVDASRSIFLELGDVRRANGARIYRSQLDVMARDVEAARRGTEEVEPLARQLDDTWTLATIHHLRGDCGLMEGNYLGALGDYREALARARALGMRSQCAVELEGLSMALAGLSRPVEAIVFRTAAQRLYREVGYEDTGLAFWDELRAQHDVLARSQLDAAAIAQATLRGESLTIEHAAEDALECSAMLLSLPATTS